MARSKYGMEVSDPDVSGKGISSRGSRYYWIRTHCLFDHSLHEILLISRKQIPDSLEGYSLKRTAEDINALAKKLGCTSIILGGHDWVCYFSEPINRCLTYHREER